MKYSTQQVIIMTNYNLQKTGFWGLQNSLVVVINKLLLNIQAKWEKENGKI